MVWATAACGEDPPSCQNAVTNFYDAGCMFSDANGNPTPLSQANAACQEANASVTDSCRGEFEDWLFCLDDIRAPVSDVICRSCSEEFDALVACN